MAVLCGGCVEVSGDGGVERVRERERDRERERKCVLFCFVLHCLEGMVVWYGMIF